MDASEMTDEQLETAVTTGVEPTPPESEEQTLETPAEEVVETPVETPEVETEEETPEVTPEETPEETPEKPPSRRESLRISQLLEKYGDPTIKREQAPKGKPDDYINNLEADPEVIEQLQTNRQAASDEAYFEGLRQSEVKDWRRDLKYEAPSVEKDFPFLNPKDEANFNPAAANAMNLKFMRQAGFRQQFDNQGNLIKESVDYPDLSYRDFVESEMEFVDELASQKVAETTKNVAQQAAQTGLRPDGSSAKRLNLNQAPEDMSMEELYASIRQKQPKN